MDGRVSSSKHRPVLDLRRQSDEEAGIEHTYNVFIANKAFEKSSQLLALCQSAPCALDMNEKHILIVDLSRFEIFQLRFPSSLGSSLPDAHVLAGNVEGACSRGMLV